MPPLGEIAKKLHPEYFGGEPEPSKADGRGEGKGKGKGKEKETHQEEEEINDMQHLSLGSTAKSRPQKPTRHSKRVDYYLNQYHDEMAGQDKAEEEEEDEEEEEEGEEETSEKGAEQEEEREEWAGYTGMTERTEPLSRKRTFGEVDVRTSDESESESLRIRGSRRNRRRTQEVDQIPGPPGR